MLDEVKFGGLITLERALSSATNRKSGKAQVKCKL